MVIMKKTTALIIRDELKKAKLTGLPKKFDGLSKRVDGLSKRVDGLSKRVDGLSKRVDGLSKRFDGLSKRVDGLSKRVDDISNRMDQVNDAARIIQENEQNLKDLGGLKRRLDVLDKIFVRVDKIAGEVTKYREEQELNSKALSNHDYRLERIEKHLNLAVTS